MQIRDTMAPGPFQAIADHSHMRRQYLSPRAPDPLEALRAIAEHADLIVVEGQGWLLCPASGPLIEQLAAVDAEREDLEDDDPGEDEDDGFTNSTGDDRSAARRRAKS